MNVTPPSPPCFLAQIFDRCLPTLNVSAYSLVYHQFLWFFSLVQSHSSFFIALLAPTSSLGHLQLSWLKKSYYSNKNGLRKSESVGCLQLPWLNKLCYLKKDGLTRSEKREESSLVVCGQHCEEQSFNLLNLFEQLLCYLLSFCCFSTLALVKANHLIQ